MLKLKGITKIYDVADEKVVALNGVDIEFRRSEFVSVLGPSGCGKTTLLNIIGGLDEYTEGTLEINGISTAEYGDRDWDSYRNHSIGFVFQNYNLINHLTVLDNVALALTLVGLDKERRTALALEALERVGLKNKALKRPNQLSGGQMQRVAIARALINDPDIILADEPTGALDSETSVQIMALLKEISLSRLVIMVTHNGELAREYSTRIVRLLDGKVVGDTNPYRSAAVQTEEAPEREEEKADRADALRFSHGKLLPDRSPLTKRELAAVKKAYVQTVDGVKFAVLTTQTGKMITPFSAAVKKGIKREFYEKKAVYGSELEVLRSAFGMGRPQKNKRVKRAKSTNKYADKPAMNAATAFKLSFTNLCTKKFRTILTAISGSIGILGISLVLALFAGLNGFIDRQEAALASNPITITKSNSDTEAIVDAVVSSLDGLNGKYDKDKVYIYKLVRQVIANQKNTNTFDKEMVDSISDISPELTYAIYKNYGLNFNVVREIPRNTNFFGMINSGASPYYMTIDTKSYWTEMPSEELVLEQYEVIEGSYPKSANEVVLILDGRNQISDIQLFFNGLNFDKVSLNYTENDLDESATLNVHDFIGMKYYLIGNDDYYYKNGSKYDTNTTINPFGPINLLNDAIARRVGSGSSNYRLQIWRGDETKDDTAYKYNKLNSSTPLTISGVIKLKEDVSVGILSTKTIGYIPTLTEKVIADSFRSKMVTELFNNYISSHPNATDMDISNEMRKYGYASTPEQIAIYCRSFSAKESVKDELDRISAERKEEGLSEIAYSDVMSVVLNIVKQFINIITCALLALTAISLVVSALMIGIITYVSVLERTREIGLLRALGARKIDISRIFNAENIIVGLISGVLGVLITYILSWPLAAIMANFTGVGGLVSLPWYFALMLVGISMLLTFIAGFIPASMAKKKDPVKALRAE